MLKPVQTACPSVGFSGVDLVAALPVIDFVCTVGATAHKVESAGNARICIIYPPLGAERLECGVSLK